MSTVRTYKNTDKEDFIQLHRNIFSSSMSDEHFAWKFENQPYVDSPQIAVARSGDKMIGAVGSILIPFKIGKNPITASMPVDIMIDEKYRSPSLFIDLINKLREIYDNVAFEFGTGAEETRKAWERFGGWTYDSVERHIRIQHPELLLEGQVGQYKSMLLKLSGTVYRTLLSIQDQASKIRTGNFNISKKDGFYEKVFPLTNNTNSFPMTIRRDPDFWRWRVSDPRIQATSYWAGKKEDPLANALVVKSKYERNPVCVMALQENRDNGAGLSALLSIYRQIFEDYRDSKYIQISNNLGREFISSSGVNHISWMRKFESNSVSGRIICHLKKEMDIDFSTNKLGRRAVGYKWFSDDIGPYSPQDWEFSDLIYDNLGLVIYD